MGNIPLEQEVASLPKPSEASVAQATEVSERDRALSMR